MFRAGYFLALLCVFLPSVFALEAEIIIHLTNDCPFSSLHLLHTSLHEEKWNIPPPVFIAPNATGVFSAKKELLLLLGDGYVVYGINTGQNVSSFPNVKTSSSSVSVAEVVEKSVVAVEWHVPLDEDVFVGVFLLPPYATQDSKGAYYYAVKKEEMRNEDGSANVRITIKNESAISNVSGFILFGHAGDPLDCCENTMCGFQHAIDAGANGLELDLSMTADGKIAAWHDWAVNWYQSLARQMGLEGLLCRPYTPDQGSSKRKDVPLLTLEELQQDYGYTEVPFLKAEECKLRCLTRECRDKCVPRTADVIPSFRQFLDAFGNNPQVKYIFLDTKVPENATFDVVDAFLTSLFDDVNACPPAVSRKLLLSSPYADVHKHMREWLDTHQSFLNVPFSKFQTTFDQDVPVGVVLHPKEFSSARIAVEEDNQFASLGAPVVTFDGWNIFMNIVQHDIQLRDAFNYDIDDPLKRMLYIVWTINDAEKIAQVVSSSIDGLLTNNVTLARLVLQENGYVLY
jgi:glycerophosphoryl diester phosphodiesterase